MNSTTTPIVNYEPYAFDDMRLTEDAGVNPDVGGADFGFTTAEFLDITIADPSHPMAASPPAGDIEVYTDPPIVTWVQPGEEVADDNSDW